MKDLSNEKTMTVKELAAVLNLDSRTVQLKVKELFPELVQNGKTTFLDEPHVTAIKINLEKKFEVKTELEKELLIQQAMIFQTEKIEKLKKENSILKPKAEFADIALRDKTEHYSITQAGKHLGIRQSEMFRILRERKLLTHENLPTQKAIDREILQLRSNPDCNGRNRQQAIMTMQNIYNFKAMITA